MAAETTDGRGGTCAPAEVKEMRQKRTKNTRGATRGPASELAAGWAEQSLRNNRLASTHPRFFLGFFFFVAFFYLFFVLVPPVAFRLVRPARPSPCANIRKKQREKKNFSSPERNTKTKRAKIPKRPERQALPVSSSLREFLLPHPFPFFSFGRAVVSTFPPYPTF